MLKYGKCSCWYKAFDYATSERDSYARSYANSVLEGSPSSWMLERYSVFRKVVRILLLEA